MNGPITISQGEPLVEAQTRIVIYTDGACLGNPGPGAWAATIRRYTDDAEIDLLPITGDESQTTNNRMEMRAAIAALEALPAGELAPISIFSDSDLLIKGMTVWMDGWIARGWRRADRKPVLNRDLWEQLLKLSEGRHINWQWVKGHAGNPLNEEVDNLAWQAARMAAVHRET